MQSHCMIIVQVFRGGNFFLVRRGIAMTSARRDSRFRMGTPDARRRPATVTKCRLVAISAVRHPPFPDAVRKREKKAPSHLGRTRAECL